MNTLSETITDKIAIEQVTARGQGSYQFVSGATDISPPAERSEDVSNDDQVELPRHRIGRQIPSRERDIAARNVSVAATVRVSTLRGYRRLWRLQAGLGENACPHLDPQSDG